MENQDLTPNNSIYIRYRVQNYSDLEEFYIYTCWTISFTATRVSDKERKS